MASGKIAEFTKMVNDMYNKEGKIVANNNWEMYREGNCIVYKCNDDSLITISRELNKLCDLLVVIEWEKSGANPRYMPKEKVTKLINGMKSKCNKFTLNIDKGYVGVATQTADGTCRMVYIEPVENEENIIKDLENLFNFKINEEKKNGKSAIEMETDYLVFGRYLR